jgi:transposase-like protein
MNVIETIQNLETQDPRAIRGYAILAKGDEPRQIMENVFNIPSQSSNKYYSVVRNGDKWTCSCPDHTTRNVTCKHIYAVKFWMALRKKMEKTDFELDQRRALNCKFCSSPSIIKYGKNGRKQVYKCKNCNRKFVNNSDFQKLKYDPRIISLTLDLYFKGVSLRKISDHLRQFYNLNVDFTTIYRWIKRYITILNEYVSSLKPELGDVWSADEMMVSIGGDWKYLWNVMDEGTRFQLASVISKERKVRDARRVFKLAKEQGKTKPRFVITDGLGVYHRAFNKEFYDHHQSCKHVSNVRLKGGINNNLIERLHGTVRDREKVMRGLKIEETPIVDGHKIYYNFIKPHMGLEGKTPAQEAGLDLGLDGDRWLGLIKKALHHHKCNTMNATP